MSDQAEGSNEKADSGTPAGNGENMVAALKTSDETEVAGKTDGKAQNATDEIAPSNPGRFSRTWGWVKTKASEAHLADWSMVLFTFIIAASTITYTVYAKRQWKAMSDQLAEMKASSTDTHALAVAAGTQADAALIGVETAQIQAATAIEALESNQAALDASIKTSRYQLRPYISSRTMDLIGEVSDGVKFSGKVNIINSGHTPAVKIEGCGDILITPFEKPITDDWTCPSPGNPKQDREFSATVLGSGNALDVSSAGTTASTKPDPLNTLLANKRVRVYFYGYVTYHDLIDPEAVHHTTFCGLYSPDLRVWVVCEKHNKAD